MKLYSQNLEQKTILQYFENKVGSFLDIGAYHPTELSNTRCLVEVGWSGVLVEPNPALHPAFEAAYGDNANIRLLPVCVGDRNAEVEFLVASGGRISWGDALSTTDPAETERWKGTGVEFVPITRNMVTFDELVKMSGVSRFDFISIDTEGNVWEILRQIDPAKTGTIMFCVEWNGVDFQQYDGFFKRHGFTERYRSPENLIYAR